METVNAGQLQLGKDTLAESQRHNKATEIINTGGVAAKVATSNVVTKAAKGAAATVGGKYTRWTSLPGIFTINLRNILGPGLRPSNKTSA